MVWTRCGSGTADRRTMTDTNKRILHIVLLLAVACAVYANSIGNEFVWDDVSIIAENPLIRDAGNLRTIFSTHYWDLQNASTRATASYRPLTVASYLLNYQLAGAEPAAFRIVNIVLHALNTCLVYLLCLLIGFSLSAALVAGLIFAVHPVHVEAVVWITGRAELLACLGFLAALCLYVLHRRGGGMLPYAGSLLVFLCALFSKESAMSLVPILACLELALPSSPGAPSRGPWRRLSFLLPYAAASIVYLLVRYAVLGVVADRGAGPGYFFQGNTSGDIFLTMVKVVAYYWVLLIMPWNLSAHYDQSNFPVPGSLAEPSLLAAAAAHAVILYGIVALYRKDRAGTALGLAWVYLGLLPYVQLVRFEWLMAERFLYIPSVGFAFAAALALEEAGRRLTVRRPGSARAVTAAVLVLVALFTVRTMARNRDWQNDLRFFGAMAHDKPGLAGARLNYGKALMKAGRYDEALVEYETVAAMRPDLRSAQETLMVLREMKRMSGGTAPAQR